VRKYKAREKGVLTWRRGSTAGAAGSDPSRARVEVPGTEFGGIEIGRLLFPQFHAVSNWAVGFITVC
jgi:hypothetical protein